MAKSRTVSVASCVALDDAARRLSKQCAVMSTLHRANGAPPERKIRADFSGLAQIVCGQQVSAASAAAIWKRVSAGVKPFNARSVRAASEQDLAALGLSRPKIRTLHALADAVSSSALNFRDLNRSDDALVFERLTALHGIGPWTADIYLLFALNRPDAFPAGDLALQLAAGRLFGATTRIPASELTALAEIWRPFRAIAARMLWDDYGRQRAAPALNKKPNAPSESRARAKRLQNLKKAAF